MKRSILTVLSGGFFLTIMGLISAEVAHAVADYWASGFPAATAANMKWTIDIPSVSTTYMNTYLVPGSKKWNGISSKVNVIKGTSTSYNVRFFVSQSLVDPSLVGLAIPYCAAGNGDICKDGSAGVQTFTAAQIVLYEAKMAKQSFTADRRIANVAHELGHVLSMRHTFSGVAPATTPSLMAAALPMISTVQNLDKANLKGKWGN